MELLLCRFFRIRIQTTSTGLSPAESITIPPRLYFCCMLITAFYTPHTNLTSSSHTTQPVSTGFSEWTSFYITTLYARLALALWRTRLPSTRQPRYGRYEVFGSAFPTHLDRVIVITSHLSLPALPHKYNSLEKRRTFFAVFMFNELSYEAAASTNTQRTPCFRCFLQDVRLTSIREQRIIWLSNFFALYQFCPSHRTSRTPRFGESNSSILVGYYRFAQLDYLYSH